MSSRKKEDTPILLDLADPQIRNGSVYRIRMHASRQCDTREVNTVSGRHWIYSMTIDIDQSVNKITH